jgi:autotransporter-like protein
VHSFAAPSTLRGRVAWAHDFNPDRNIAATFQTLPGASFVVNGAAQASDSALTTASAELKWRNGWSAAATFEGEFSDVTRSYAGKGRGAIRVVEAQTSQAPSRLALGCGSGRYPALNARSVDGGVGNSAPPCT